MKRTLLVLTAALALSAPVFAFPGGPGPHGGPHGMMGPHGPGIERFLFPPEMVLQNQIALGLTDEQLEAIKKMINETHSQVLDYQTELQRLSEQLRGILDSPTVDEAAALETAGRAMQLESEVKKAHLSLAIRIKNLLTPEQQEKLRAMRKPPHPER